MKQNKNDCYYYSYGICSRKGFTHSEKACVGCSECEGYISENQFFLDAMNGTLPKDPIKTTQKVTSNQPNPNLIIGKSKKALKREAKLEAEKNNKGSGFSLLDDPRFKDLFSGK